MKSFQELLLLLFSLFFFNSCQAEYLEPQFAVTVTQDDQFADAWHVKLSLESKQKVLLNRHQLSIELYEITEEGKLGAVEVVERPTRIEGLENYQFLEPLSNGVEARNAFYFACERIKEMKDSSTHLKAIVTIVYVDFKTRDTFRKELSFKIKRPIRR